MKTPFPLIAAIIGFVLVGIAHNMPAGEPGKPLESVKATAVAAPGDVHLTEVSPGKVASELKQSPPLQTELESAKVNTAPPRIPVYVIPEAVAVQTPIGVIVFAERWHVEELAKKYPAHKLTNIIVWSH